MTKLIAVCGVDGAGKSSLIRAYGERRPAVATCHKTADANVQLTQRYHRRSEGSAARKADWLSGPFALSIGAGAMFDFLGHYDRAIAKQLGRAQTLLCDRYSPCFLAYLDGAGHVGVFDPLLARVQPADHVIHVEVADELLQQRYDSRQEKNEDEFIELMQAFRAGYDSVYRRLGITPTIITNNADFNAAYRQFEAVVDGL